MTNQSNDIPDGFKMTELGLLPEEWGVARVAEIALKRKFAIVDGPFGSQMKVSEFTTTGVPVVEMDQLKNNNLGMSFRRFISQQKYSEVKRSTVTAGDLIISKTGTLGLVGMLPSTVDKAVMTSRLAKVSVDQNSAANEFVYFAFLLLRETGYWEGVGEGTTMKVLSIRKIGDALIPFPPLPEQKAIAGVLSTIQNAIEAQDKVIAAARELKKSLMKHLFTYGPVPVADAEKVSLKETEIGPLPEHWEVMTLGEVAEQLIGGGTPSTGQPEYWDGPIHWTTSRRIEGIHLSSGERGITERGLEDSSTHLIPRNNLLIGTRVGVGKVAVNDVHMAISQDLTGMLVDKDKYEIEFLAYEIASPRGQNQFINYMRGTTIKGIPREDLKRIPLGIPPVPEQQEIGHILATADTKIEAGKKRKASLQTLFETMLHHLMTGKLRVKDLEVTAE